MTSQKFLLLRTKSHLQPVGLVPVATKHVSELASAGQEHILAKIVPPAIVNSTCDDLSELDAYQLVFTSNAAPQSAP